MALAGPFYFAWVEPDETVFGPEHHVMDEYIFSAVRTLAEGEKPLLEIEIQNPHVGILNPSRKYWAWFAWDDGSTGGGIVPLFFGRVVGSPVEIFEEVIKLQLVADPIDYRQRVQQVAETLKVPPFYDPVFIDVSQRDDPNTILEAHAKVWDVDAVTHAVTANDIIIGDSNEDFTGDDHFYDGMTMTIGQPPATAILMDASVSWTQTAHGLIDITGGYRTFGCLNGDGIISDWPKPLTDIGGGYRVYSSDAYDNAGAADAEVVTTSWSWSNKSKEHSDGDSLSKSWSYSAPMGGQIWNQQLLTFTYQFGFLDPFATDGNGDPAPINIPMSYNDTTGYVMGWNVSASLVLQYAAARQRTERVIFLVRANTQAVLTSPELSQESETMTRSGADVGVPIIGLLNWTTISGTAVAVGQIIFPDNPQVPGGKSAQICVTAGTAGTVVPAFSDIAGVTTADGSVVWSSLGAATPTDNAVNWTETSHANAGTIILPQRPFEANPSTIYPGSTYYIATTAGTTGTTFPAFNTALHATTSDGSVIWTSIGSGEIPAGGYPGEVHAATYFASDRGRQSLEYLSCLVRARLLYRARCIEIQFDCEYGRGVDLTTRKTATLHDPRIAGGVALGKVTGAELSVSDSGVAGCKVTLACCAGYGDAIDEVPGDPGYVAVGYVETGYQWYDNSTVVLPDTTDLGYAPPLYVPSDDHLTFPLTRDQVVVVDAFHAGADVSSQALQSMADAAKRSQGPPSGSGLEGVYAKQKEVKMLAANSLGALLKENPSWQEFELKPCTGGPFHKVYNVAFTDLSVPMGIDLESGVTA